MTRSALGSVAALAVETGRALADRLDRRSPVPRTIDQVDAGYLRRLLGAPITQVDPSDRTVGTTDRARLRLAGTDDRIAPSVFVKIAPTRVVTRVFTNLSNLGPNECGFYRDLRPGLDIETPVVVAIDADPRTRRFVIVIEDLAARDVRFTDTIQGTTRAEAEAVIRTLARLHAAFWDSPRLADRGPGGLSWVTSNGGDPNLRLVHQALGTAARRLTKTDPALVPPAGAEILARYPAVADEMDVGPHTILHGDPHPGNVYFVDDADGPQVRGGLFDWQVLRRGNGVRDLTYFMVLALEPDDRRAYGDELVDLYRDELIRAGGPALDPGALRLDVRKMVAYAYVSAVFTTAFAGLQDREIAHRGLTKATAALLDLDTAAALTSLR